MEENKESEISFGGSREDWLSIEQTPKGYALSGNILKTDIQKTLRGKFIPLFWIGNQCVNGYTVQWADGKDRKLSELKGLRVLLTKLDENSVKFMCTVL